MTKKHRHTLNAVFSACMILAVCWLFTLTDQSWEWFTNFSPWFLALGTITGIETGALQVLANCAGVSATGSSTYTGSAGLRWGVNAPAALSGTITTGTITLGSTATFAGTEKVCVFWTVAGVDYYRYDCTIAGGTGTSFAITDGAGTALPDGGQAVTLATNQDVTDSVSINGDNIKQLLATSTQKGLVEWLTVTPTQQRLSIIPAASGYDTWPLNAGTTAPPSGWSAATTVVTLRFWNAATSAARMEVGVVLT